VRSLRARRWRCLCSACGARAQARGALAERGRAVGGVGQDIFAAKPSRRYSPFCATFTKETLQSVVDHYISSRTLGDMRTHVLITSFKVGGGEHPPADSPDPAARRAARPAAAAVQDLRALWHPAVITPRRPQRLLALPAAPRLPGARPELRPRPTRGRPPGLLEPPADGRARRGAARPRHARRDGRDAHERRAHAVPAARGVRPPRPSPY